MNTMIAVFSTSLFVSTPGDPATAGPSRAEVVTALRHHEGLVKTLRADYTITTFPTMPPEKYEILRKALGNKKAQRYLVKRSATAEVRFWRKGEKQRDEVRYSEAPSQSTTRAFDGQILRAVNENGPGARPTASIASAKTGDWYLMPRTDPFGFLYRFYERPFSEVIALASSFTSAVGKRGEEPLYRVVIRCPDTKNELEFLFDRRFLQRERILKVWGGPKHDRLLPNHKLEFKDYRAYETPSGETIWFPENVTYTGYSMEGTATDGSPLECNWSSFHFTNVQFNIDMADSLFELEIPKDARINDLLTGAGWLDTGKRPALLFPAEARARRLWTAAIVLATVVLVTIAVFYKRRRQRMAGG